MTRRTHAIAAVLVMLLVVGVCAASFADAVDAATNVCEPAKGWAPTKVDSSASAKPEIDVPATPVASVAVFEPTPRWAGVDAVTPASSRVVLVQPRSPRAPPLA